MRVLVIEDDMMLAESLREGLEHGGFAVDHLIAAEPAESTLTLTHYDLAIVDLGLPGMNGHELIRRLRYRGVQVPILILTARDGLDDRISGLDLGADDYMLKPFQLPELLARMRALIRRSNSATSSILKIGALCLDLARRVASKDDAVLDLTGREWEILQQLMLSSPNVVPKQKMAESLSEWDNEITENAVQIYVSRLRQKLQGCGIEVRTIRGIGYRLDELNPEP
jgi:two-component system, OmpR family, response regulator